MSLLRRVTACVGLLSAAAFALAPGAGTDAEPEVLRTMAGTTEVGTLNDVAYRIDVPATWNHALVVFFHGYAEATVSFHATSALSDQLQPIFDRGYAVIQSGFSAPGWALAEGFPETEQLRRYFVRRYAGGGNA